MSRFSYDVLVEKCVSVQTEETDWAMTMDICDKMTSTPSDMISALMAICKQLKSDKERAQSHALTLLDACVMNCGKNFRKEMASSDFVKEARLALQKGPSNFSDKFKKMIQKWAENEFKNDSSLEAIPNLYQTLRSEGAYFGMKSDNSSSSSKGPSVRESTKKSSSKTKEEEDLEKAIALSLKEQGMSKTSQKNQSVSLYPTLSSGGGAAHVEVSQPLYTPPQQTNAPSSKGKQARALWDFEAVEDNELTFTSGEIVTILDDSDSNWWKASSWRGEGLIPANFVNTDLSAEPESDTTAASSGKSVQFNDEVQVQQFDPETVQIDGNVIDRALDLIQNSDPTGVTQDDPEMLQLEEQCKVMTPLIDQQLEVIDRDHNELMSLNTKLMESFQLYTNLMQQSAHQPAVSYPSQLPPYSSSMMPPQQQYQQYQQPVPMSAPQTATSMSQAPMSTAVQYQQSTYNQQVPNGQTMNGPAPGSDSSALLNQYMAGQGIQAVQNLQYIPTNPASVNQQHNMYQPHAYSQQLPSQ